jgi:hypothetical protein
MAPGSPGVAMFLSRQREVRRVSLTIAASIREFARTFKVPLIAFLISLSMFLVCREYAQAGLPYKASNAPWDMGWYGNMIERGYSTDGNDNVEHNVVFFPLYPALCWIVKQVLRVQTLTAMSIVSAGSTLVMLLLLYRLLTRYYSSFLAGACVLFLAISPFSVFLYAGYTEALYVCLVVAFFYFLTKGSYTGAALISGLTSASRPYGCLLAFVLVFEMARRHYIEYGFKWSLRSRYLQGMLVLFPICCSGLIAYTLYLGYRFDDPLAFSHNLKPWGIMGGRIQIADALTFRYFVPLIGTTLLHFKLTHPIVTGLLWFVATPVLLILLGRRLFPSALFFAVLMFLFFHYTLLKNEGAIVDMGRHFTLLFPVPLLLVLALEPRAVAGWIRNLISAASDRGQPMCACIALVSVLPYALLLVVSAYLAMLYTVVFYRLEFVF